MTSKELKTSGSASPYLATAAAGNNSTSNPDLDNLHVNNITSKELKTSGSASPYLAAASSLASLAEILTSEEPEEFKPTEDLVVTALNDHLLEDFIVSYDHLNILETLGEGNNCITIKLQFVSVIFTSDYAMNKLHLISSMGFDCTYVFKCCINSTSLLFFYTTTYAIYVCTK